MRAFEFSILKSTVEYFVDGRCEQMLGSDKKTFSFNHGILIKHVSRGNIFLYKNPLQWQISFFKCYFRWDPAIWKIERDPGLGARYSTAGKINPECKFKVIRFDGNPDPEHWLKPGVDRRQILNPGFKKKH